MKYITTFPETSSFEKATDLLAASGLAYQVLPVNAAYSLVGVSGLITDSAGRAALWENPDIGDAGWVDYRATSLTLPDGQAEVYSDDLFGRAEIVHLAPCVADLSRIRLVARVTGCLTEAMPYLNAEIPGAFFNPETLTLTLMDQYRMVVVYPHRITIAKADGLPDAWRTLEAVRRQINSAWRNRNHIEPCYTMRRKPPALEIYKRLPGTNCRLCGERTCMAFALRVWNGELAVTLCTPVFQGDQRHLQPALEEICAGLGVAAKP